MDVHVGVDDADERHAREVESLGDHLRAEQHVDVAPAHAVQDPLMRPLPRGRVDVHARDARCREGLRRDPGGRIAWKLAEGAIDAGTGDWKG